MARILHRNQSLNAAVQVAVHHIGRANVDNRIATVLKRKHARVLQEAAQHGTDTDILAQTLNARAQSANTANHYIHRHTSLRSAVQRIDDGLIHHGVALNLNLRRAASLVVLNLLINALNQAATQSTRRHQQRLVVGLRCVTRQLVEQAGNILTNLLIAGDDAQILVETSRRRVVVTGTNMSVTAQVVTLAAHHQRQLAVSLQTHDAVHHVHAGALQLTSPRDVGFLIKASLNLDQRHNLLARFSRLNQRIHDGGVTTGAVQGLLNRLNTRVSGSLRQERLHTGRKRIVRVVQQHVMVAGGSEYIRSLRGLGGVEPTGSVRNVLGVVQSRAVRSNNRTHAAQIQRSRQTVHLRLVDVQLRNQQIQDGRVDGVLNLQTDRGAETTAQKLLLQGL